MRRASSTLLLVLLCLLIGCPAEAQDPPPRIGPFVADLRGTVLLFSDDPLLAESHALSVGELPGFGLGASLGVHLFVVKVGPVTVGIGGEAMVGRSRSEPRIAADQSFALRSVNETFKTISPQLSLNFGDGDGWSYLSAGIGQSVWSLVPEGVSPLPVDEEAVKTVNYGGGARWFVKKHLAFSLDVRIYQTETGVPQVGLPGRPRMRLLVIAAGVAVK